MICDNCKGCGRIGLFKRKICSKCGGRGAFNELPINLMRDAILRDVESEVHLVEVAENLGEALENIASKYNHADKPHIGTHGKINSGSCGSD